MYKELKISELASIWGTSVPTTWNRIRKEGLTTFKKKDENNKEVNFVTISDDILNKYINNVNNLDNNLNYEDMLNVNNVNNNVDNLKIEQEKAFNKDDIKDIINTITMVNNDYNERLTTLTDRLINAESKQLLLEDTKHREGYYINEINELKKENKLNKLYNKVFIAIITVLICGITYCVTVMTLSKSAQVEPESAQVSVQVEQPKAEQPKPAPVKQPVRRR